LAFRETETVSSRDLVELLDGMGCDYYSNTSVLCTFFGGALPASELYRALPVYADVVRNPRLSPDWLEESRLACLQEVEALEDDLPGKVMQRLKMLQYGEPWGRQAEGTVESLRCITIDEIRDFVRSHYDSEGAIISVAGKFDFDELRDCVGQLFDGWTSQASHPPGEILPSVTGSEHISFPSQQTHIGIAWPGLPYSDESWHLARCAAGVLSDGMSSRLFREVREKRGLCYSVAANCHAVPGRGACFAYCGTTTEYSQQALDVIIGEIVRLQSGITEDELRRLKTQVRSGLIMQQESCRSRAGTLVNDSLLLGRLRSVDELSERIESLTLDEMNIYLSQNPAGPFNLVTLGEQPLELGSAVSTANA
jgi:predicted Zn-dependent peptidase